MDQDKALLFIKNHSFKAKKTENWIIIYIPWVNTEKNTSGIEKFYCKNKKDVLDALGY